jgi:hypothetical protein
VRRSTPDPAPINTDTTDIALRMVRQLNCRDFETLVDLIFLRGGWQRISALGGDQAHVDLVLSEPISGETA